MHCSLVHLLYGLPRSAHGRRGWAAPLSSREGVGDGWSCSLRSRSSAPVTRPTALLIPQQVPLVADGGAAWGSAVGRSGARAALHTSGGCAGEAAAPSPLPRDGASAAAVPKSTATGAAD